MITNNKLDKSFGPVGTIAGITIFIVGLALVFFSLAGLFLIILGAFVGFSSTSTILDFDTKRIKFSNNLFGFLRYGHWIDISSDMKIGIEKSNRTWRAYSRGSRTIDISDKDFRIILYNAANKPILPIMKVVNAESAKIQADKLCGQLGLGLL